MSPEDFEKCLEFGILTPSEKEFVLRFIETMDVDAATLAAHPGAKNQRALRWQMRNNSRILAALHLWFGKPPISLPTPKEQAVRDLQQDVRRLRGVARVQARRLLLELQGVLEVSGKRKQK